MLLMVNSLAMISEMSGQLFYCDSTTNHWMPSISAGNDCSYEPPPVLLGVPLFSTVYGDSTCLKAVKMGRLQPEM